MVILTHKKIKEQQEWNQEVIFDRVHTLKLSVIKSTGLYEVKRYDNIQQALPASTMLFCFDKPGRNIFQFLRGKTPQEIFRIVAGTFA